MRTGGGRRAEEEEEDNNKKTERKKKIRLKERRKKRTKKNERTNERKKEREKQQKNQNRSILTEANVQAFHIVHSPPACITTDTEHSISPLILPAGQCLYYIGPGENGSPKSAENTPPPTVTSTDTVRVFPYPGFSTGLRTVTPHSPSAVSAFLKKTE